MYYTDRVQIISTRHNLENLMSYDYDILKILIP